MIDLTSAAGCASPGFGWFCFLEKRNEIIYRIPKGASPDHFMYDWLPSCKQIR